MKRWIIHLVAVFVMTFAVPVVQARDTALVEMRLVLANPTPDTEDIEYWNDGIETNEVLHVLRRPIIDQTTIRSASVKKVDEHSYAYVELVLTDKGRDWLAATTRENIGKRLAIVVDGRVLVAPKIVAEISDGKVWIAGRFSDQDAADLAARINKALKKD